MPTSKGSKSKKLMIADPNLLTARNLFACDYLKDHSVTKSSFKAVWDSVDSGTRKTSHQKYEALSSVINVNSDIVGNNPGGPMGEGPGNDGRTELMDLVVDIGHSSSTIGLSDGNSLARREGLDKDASSGMFPVLTLLVLGETVGTVPMSEGELTVEMSSDGLWGTDMGCRDEHGTSTMIAWVPQPDEKQQRELLLRLRVSLIQHAWDSREGEGMVGRTVGDRNGLGEADAETNIDAMTMQPPGMQIPTPIWFA
ncbi:hypothetical protein H4582DRAFT_2063022 [Lactarius indigo]|nr:hypothetical protein H4582DRAFT_2063022 [Lactarius indigo]